MDSYQNQASDYLSKGMLLMPSSQNNMEALKERMSQLEVLGGVPKVDSDESS